MLQARTSSGHPAVSLLFVCRAPASGRVERVVLTALGSRGGFKTFSAVNRGYSSLSDSTDDPQDWVTTVSAGDRLRAAASTVPRAVRFLCRFRWDVQSRPLHLAWVAANRDSLQSR